MSHPHDPQLDDPQLDDPQLDDPQLDDPQLDDDDYLWDRSGEVDSQIADLEEVLVVLRSRAAMPAVAPPVAPAAPSRVWWLAVAAGFFLVVAGWLAREGAGVAPPVARLNIPQVSVPNVPPSSLDGSAAASASPVGLSWTVAVLRGAPTCDGLPVRGQAQLRVGGWVETDATSRARVTVADVGTLELEPGSKLRLVQSSKDDHRVELARGVLRATIDAPPRVFSVGAPNVTYVDLGCEYQVEVAEDGSSWIRVQRGWVELETPDAVRVVPADAMCHTAADGTPGLPVRRSAPASLVDAATRVAAGATDQLSALLEEATASDVLTLWHLLAHAPSADRRSIFDRVVSLRGKPADEAGVLAGDRGARDDWGRALGILPPPGWPDEGPPDPPAPVWRPENAWSPQGERP